MKGITVETVEPEGIRKDRKFARFVFDIFIKDDKSNGHTEEEIIKGMDKYLTDMRIEFPFHRESFTIYDKE